MRDQWYSDKRDLVKWGVLLELARRYGAEHILQVLYYRPSSYGRLNIQGEECDLPPAVIRHFRRINAVTSIQCEAKVEVIEEVFKNRKPYLDLVLGRMHLRPHGPGIVLLDPDTGLAPSHPGPKHVLDKELEAIWRELRQGDLLVFYQHRTNRKGVPWIDAKREQFERAIGLASGASKLARAPSIAGDVVFFYARKCGGAI